jgi:hypothetical protein
MPPVFIHQYIPEYWLMDTLSNLEKYISGENCLGCADRPQVRDEAREIIVHAILGKFQCIEVL